jgi:hypothetical protein
MREPCYSRMISRLAQIQGPRRIPQTFIAGLVAKHNGSQVALWWHQRAIPGESVRAALGLRLLS